MDDIKIEVQKRHLEEFLHWMQAANTSSHSRGTIRSPTDQSFVQEQNALNFTTYMIRFKNDLLFRLTALKLYNLIEQWFVQQLTDSELARLIADIKEEATKASQQNIFNAQLTEFLRKQSLSIAKMNAEKQEATMAAFHSALEELINKRRLYSQICDEYDRLTHKYYSERLEVARKFNEDVNECSNVLVNNVFNIPYLPPLPEHRENMSAEEVDEHIQKEVDNLEPKKEYSEEYVRISREMCVQKLQMQYLEEEGNKLKAEPEKNARKIKAVVTQLEKLQDNYVENAEKLQQLDEGISPEFLKAKEKLHTKNQEREANLSTIKDVYEPQLQALEAKNETLRVELNAQYNAHIDLILTSLLEILDKDLNKEQKKAILNAIQQIHEIRDSDPNPDPRTHALKDTEYAQILDNLLQKIEKNRDENLSTKHLENQLEIIKNIAAKRDYLLNGNAQDEMPNKTVLESVEDVEDVEDIEKFENKEEFQHKKEDQQQNKFTFAGASEVGTLFKSESKLETKAEVNGNLSAKLREEMRRGRKELDKEEVIQIPEEHLKKWNFLVKKLSTIATKIKNNEESNDIEKLDELSSDLSKLNASEIDTKTLSSVSSNLATLSESYSEFESIQDQFQEIISEIQEQNANRPTFT